MLRNRALPLLLAICGILFHAGIADAQTSSAAVQEDFTGTTTTNPWYFYNGACLTASSAAPTLAPGPGTPPGCKQSNYYNEHLVGGYNGVSGSSETLPDPAGFGALRFTNGCIPDSNGNCSSGGYSQNGAIISQNAFSTSQGLDITFKTVTYRGDSGGNGAGCPSGTTASSGQCITTQTATPTVSCPSGYTLNSSRTSCKNGSLSTAPTYTCPVGYTKSGSGSSTTCTETTVVEQNPHQNDGADGMSFFLMDGSVDMTNNAIDHIGSWGGSLGYTCSNVNTNFHGMVGAYLGLGIDEYGNFLNGSTNTLGVSNPQALGDNTASGGGQWANRIGLRGQGNIDWYWLNATYPDLYPSSWTTTNSSTCSARDSSGACIAYYSKAQMSVKNTCRDGYLADDNNSALSNNGTSPYTVPDYNAIPNAFTIIPNTIAKEYSAGGYSRQNATPITYRLKLTEDGLLTLDYSYNGGSWTNVIKNQNIATSNGTVPATVRFGFAGSTGGHSNIHEILCFKATPVTSAASSTTVNQQQSSRVENGSQAYFGYYDPTNWTGRLTANSLLTDSSGNLSIASSANWDASCALTGVASGTSCPTTGANGPTAAQAWQNSSAGGRVMLTWSGSAGIPLEWSSLSSDEQTALDLGDSSQTEYRLDYLRGDRSNEIPSTGPTGTKVYRDRDSVLGDIVDSSSTWIGPPSKSVFSAYEFPATWRDKLYTTATMGENSGQTYDQYAQAKATRLNVVYVGSNDGLLHGFSAGSYDSGGTVYDGSTNTGQEVLAYMPQGVLEKMHNSNSPTLDFSNTQYGHNFFVDATPGTGDLYYNNAWHTWLVGGVGPGGAEIYALDVTDPSTFTEANASSLVIGDWTPSNITCTNPTTSSTTNCTDTNGNSYLGNTYGTPQIRRLHNGDWAVIFGNGIGSASGDAGIFILTIDPTGVQTLYYLSTGVAGSNGIAYATPVDLDGDHVVDYVYAGDLLGNVWRFDLTSNDPGSWAVTPGPLFKAPSGQPITTAIQPDFVTGPIGSSTTQLMLFFGSGEKFPVTSSSTANYATGTQYFYGVWDWNMTAWDAHNSSQFANVSASTVGTLTSLASPYTMGQSNLRSQTVTIDTTSGNRVVSSANTVCWAGTSTCTGGSSANKTFGWYIGLPGTNTAFSTTTYEQLTFNPGIVSTAVVFNTIEPAVDSPLMCTPDTDKGWTYALDVRNGTPVPNFFVSAGTSSTNNLATTTVGYEVDASGSSSVVVTSDGNGGTKTWLVSQSENGGAANPIQVQPAANISGSRQTWIQLR